MHLLKWLWNLTLVNLFIVLLPFLLVAAAIWGSEDEQWLVKTAFLVLWPITAIFWYCLFRAWRRLK